MFELGEKLIILSLSLKLLPIEVLSSLAYIVNPYISLHFIHLFDGLDVDLDLQNKDVSIKQYSCFTSFGILIIGFVYIFRFI